MSLPLAGLAPWWVVLETKGRRTGRQRRTPLANGPFDGLSILVRSVLAHDPVSGHIFVFLNRRRTQVRLLWWSRGGFAILGKRLAAHRQAALISSR